MSGDTAAGGTAGLRRFEFFAVRNTAADLFHDLAQGGAHRDLHQTGMFDFAAQREHLGALGLFGAHRSEPIRAFQNDLGNVGEGFHVVFHGGAAKQTLDRRIGRAGTRLAAVAFDGGHQRGFSAADERARAQPDLHIKFKAGAENILAQQALGARFVDCDLQTAHRDGILRPHIHKALGRADGVTRDRHRLDQAMGIAFQHRAIHKRAGVTLVRVADHIFLRRFVGGGQRPFASGGETAAAASAQAGIGHDLDDLLRGVFGQTFAQRLIAVVGNVFFQRFGVDHAAVAQRHPHLFFVKIGFVQRFDLVLTHCFIIQQTGDDAPFQQMLRHDFGDILHRDP